MQNFKKIEAITLSKDDRRRDLKDLLEMSPESSIFSLRFRSIEKSNIMLRSIISAMVVRECFKGRPVTSLPNCINSLKNSNVSYLRSLILDKNCWRTNEDKMILTAFNAQSIKSSCVWLFIFCIPAFRSFFKGLMKIRTAEKKILFQRNLEELSNRKIFEGGCSSR